MHSSEHIQRLHQPTQTHWVLGRPQLPSHQGARADISWAAQSPTVGAQQNSAPWHALSAD